MNWKEKIDTYREQFSESRFWTTLQRYSRRLGQGTVYSALLLFYAYKRKDTPGWAKRIVLGTLGYLLFPFDAVPDLSPLIGFTDDVGVLSFGLVTIAAYVNEQVRKQARGHLKKWFGECDEAAIAAVDAKL